MRSKNDGKFISATLRAVYSQDFSTGVELVHIDSGSTDGTIGQIRASNPWKLIQIPPADYIPGVILNLGMREARSEWVAFLNSDAEPANRSWLAELLAMAQSDPEIATAFSRQIPRPECQAVFAHDYERCFGPARESLQWDNFFSMVSCVVNRTAWQEHPFREDLQFAEDDEWSRRLRKYRWKVAFAEKSIAMHSHNYTLRQAYSRAYGDNFASAATLVELHNWQSRAGLGSFRDAIRDLSYCARKHRLKEWPHAVAVRIAQRIGKVCGYRAGLTHYGRADS